MSVDTVYVLAGGDIVSAIFNGIAIMMGTTSWATMFRIAGLVSIFTLFFVYIRGHDPKEIIGFIAMFLFITSVMVIPRRTVQVIDRTDPASVYVVDNVPLGLAVPARFISTIGTALTEGMEAVFHTPDSLAYSKTGMLFGAKLVGSATDFMLADGDLADLFNSYVRNCVVGDIMLNHKYSLQTLMNSPDPYSIIFSRPSPLRGVMVGWNNTAAPREGFWTCEELARNVLEPRLNEETSQGGTTWHYWLTRLTGAHPDRAPLFGALMAESYNYFYDGGMTASQIMRSAVVMNGLRQGIESVASRSGNAAGLLNLSTQTSYAKMWMSQATAAKIATTYLPLLNTILMIMLFGMYPFIILLAAIHVLSMKVLKNYIFAMIYLQAWAPLFAILNYAMNIKLGTESQEINFSLSNLSLIQQNNISLGVVAGYVALSVPVIAGMVVWGLAAGMTQVFGSFSHALNSTASSEASNATTGQWAFDNLQTDNVSGNKWDTNYSQRAGQVSTQLENGATVTKTGSGGVVYNTTENTSNLPVSLQMDKMVSSGFQRQQREAMQEAESLNNSLSQTASLGATQLSQWSQQRGNSDSTVSGSDSSRASNVTAALNTLNSLTSRYARDNNVSQSDAVRSGMIQSQNMSLTAGASASVGFDGNRQFAGKILGLATGMSAKGDLHGRADYNGTDGSSHGTSNDLTNRSGNSKDYSAQELKDFRHAVDVITSQRATDSGSHTDTTSGSLVNQVAGTFSTMQNEASQYNDAVSRSHEYAQMANYTESHSAAIRENATQEFAAYVRENHPDADRLLTDTESPSARVEREQLAGRFVEERMMPALKAEFEANRARAAEGVGEVSPGGLHEVSPADFDAYQTKINRQAEQHGVRSSEDIHTQVQAERGQADQNFDVAQNKTNKAGHQVQGEYNKLENEHKDKSKGFDAAKDAEEYRQNAYPVFNHNGDAKEKLKDIMKNFKK